MNLQLINENLMNRERIFTAELVVNHKNNQDVDCILMKEEGNAVGFNIPLQFLENKSDEEIADVIYDLASNEQVCFDVEKLASEQYIADNIFVKLMNKQNMKWLDEQDIVYDVISDDVLAVYAVLVYELEQGFACYNLHWKQIENTIYGDEFRYIAFENMAESAEIISMTEILLGNGFDDDPCVIVSNKYRTWGAGSIVSPAVRLRVFEKLHEDFYIIPSSVHEVICMRKSFAISNDQLYSMIKEVNETVVDVRDRLSDYPLLAEYDPEKDFVKLLSVM